MSGSHWWSAHDPVSTALSTSSTVLRQRDRAALIENSADLIALYKGYQQADAERQIATLFADEKIRARYKKHVDTFNVTALIVDRVATLGRDPIKVEWLDASGQPSEADAALWAEIADANGWDGFMQSVGQRLELLSSLVLAAYWDEHQQRVRLHQYTPNVFEVRSSEGRDALDPDLFRIFQDDDAFQLWDFSKDIPVQGEGSGWEIEEPRPLELIDPATNRPLVPFVPLRKKHPVDDYWIDEGQEDLLTTNRKVNNHLTALSVILHYGAYQIPIGEGPGWQSRDVTGLVLDVAELLIVPDSQLSDKPTTIRWAGPANETFIDKHHEAVRQKIALATAARGIDPAFIRVEGGQERSGISLWIGNQALVERQKSVKTMARQPLKRLVEIIRITQDTFGARKFSAGATFTLTIPDIQFAVEPKTKVETDKLALDAGFRRKRDLVREYNPGWTDAQVEEFLAETAPAAVQSPSLFRRPAAPGIPPVPPAPPSRG